MKNLNLSELIKRFNATNKLLLSIAEKHDILGAIINNDEYVLQDIIDNNNDFIDGFKNHQSNNGWISIDDDVPKIKGRYLCFYPKSAKQYVEPFMLEHTLNDKEYMQALGISHWQYLPQPPKE